MSYVMTKNAEEYRCTVNLLGSIVNEKRVRVEEQHGTDVRFLKYK